MADRETTKMTSLVGKRIMAIRRTTAGDFVFDIGRGKRFFVGNGEYNLYDTDGNHFDTNGIEDQPSQLQSDKS